MDTDQDPGEPSGTNEPTPVSAKTERELALRMITSRAIADPDFYDQLRADPRQAIENLHIVLDDADLDRFRNVDWERIDDHVNALRQELGIGTTQLGGGW